jgi:hypothetical protein
LKVRAEKDENQPGAREIFRSPLAFSAIIAIENNEKRENRLA